MVLRRSGRILLVLLLLISFICMIRLVVFVVLVRLRLVRRLFVRDVVLIRSFLWRICLDGFAD